jgi:hypothetical protein
MTPGASWRRDYAEWPVALAKLEYCDAKMKALANVPPPITKSELDEDVEHLPMSIDEYYNQTQLADAPFPPGIDGALRSVFEDLGVPEESDVEVPRHSAAQLLLKLESTLMADVFRWTGHFPELTRALIRHLARRADEMQQVYPEDREAAVIVGITTLVTSLAMTHVVRGSYLPEK